MKSLIPLLALTLVACGPTSTVTGDVRGVPLHYRDGVATVGLQKGPDGRTWGYVMVTLGDYEGVCGIAQQRANKASSTRLTLSMINLDGTAVGPDGRFVREDRTGTEERIASAVFTSLDGACGSSTDGATQGYVVVKELGAMVKGEFDIEFEKGSLVGTFEVPLCAYDGLAAPTNTCLR